MSLTPRFYVPDPDHNGIKLGRHTMRNDMGWFFRRVYWSRLCLLRWSPEKIRPRGITISIRPLKPLYVYLVRPLYTGSPAKSWPCQSKTHEVSVQRLCAVLSGLQLQRAVALPKPKVPGGEPEVRGVPVDLRWCHQWYTSYIVLRWETAVPICSAQLINETTQVGDQLSPERSILTSPQYRRQCGSTFAPAHWLIREMKKRPNSKNSKVQFMLSPVQKEPKKRTCWQVRSKTWS